MRLPLLTTSQWIGLPRWVRYPLIVVRLAGGLAALASLLPDHSRWGGLSGSIGVLVVQLVRNRVFDRLSVDDRLRVIAAERTGVATGDPRLDGLARDRLSRAAGSYRSDRIFQPLALLLLAATPIAAAIEHGTCWWLLALLPLIVLPGRLIPRDPRPALAALSAATTRPRPRPRPESDR